MMQPRPGYQASPVPYARPPGAPGQAIVSILISFFQFAILTFIV
jgi:hypothetical protein